MIGSVIFYKLLNTIFRLLINISKIKINYLIAHIVYHCTNLLLRSYPPKAILCSLHPGIMEQSYDILMVMNQLIIHN